MCGESPFNEGRTVRPFLVRDGGRILARVLAVMDARYNHHWNERLGHLCWFEALPDTREAVKHLIDEACQWLKTQGANAARSGSGVLEQPFVIDDYDILPPPVLRHNPAYYHALLKDAGFELERSYADYKIAVCPELVVRWESMCEAGIRRDYKIVPLHHVAQDRRVREFTATFNETFKTQWGWSPYTEDEIAVLLQTMERHDALATSVLAYKGDDLVGMLLLIPEHSNDAVVQFPRRVHDSERLNVMAIGVQEAARGRGVGLAMAGYGLAELARRGTKYASYTLVRDDNWPSRRIAEKLGAFVCANYVVYRRNFG
jgi:GNAT superfamily N-acetyltransferase